ncbi:purple acid phosphatase family protein [Planctomyces sp. SH-PL62]|uniref:purple acid phosphatase family protein n=1 Tax=Planctomyces sp. SH-PL62 TaxID=1636152 RepID=UPI00078DC742|nr:metallophosphoesterase family protein [Planctomyces sp. SH-PL62]AMV39881.1 Calcineurin-like phosphoesterase [Planctomyces sp. SH-PL62]
MHEWKRCRVWLVLLALASAGCRDSAPVESLPGVRASLDAAGVRLSQIKSERELTAAATRQAMLLPWLDPAERDALGRNAVRFRAEAPVMVAVASPSESAPFWLDDQGFRRSGLTIHVDGRPWDVRRKTFPAGWVGLGVNGLDRSPQSHYVAFVQAAPGRDPLDASSIALVHDADSPWKAVLASEGVSATNDGLRPIRELPAELEGSVLLQPAHDRRHAALLAGGRVWKTHSVSTNVPDQTVISFGEDPTRQLVVGWRTSPEVTSSVVRIAPAKYQTPEDDPTSPPDLVGTRTIQGQARPLRADGLLNDPVVQRHAVVIDGLEPDTVYYYSVGDGSPKNWGPWRTVKTGPARPRRMEFLYLGDAQTGFESWGKLLTAAYRRHPGMDFILLAGDLVDRGNERTNWDHFFLRAAAIFDRVPLMPAAGNHEYLDRGPWLYNSVFRLPQDGPPDLTPGLAYTFRYGGAFFAVLDSTSAVMSETEARRQADWLDQALAGCREDWKFVIFHHPIYPSHPTRDNPVIRDAWVPVFDRHHVDMVLQGHDHAYLRTPPMRNHQRVSTSEEGTTYVVAVSGDKFVVDQPQREYIEFGRTRTSTYQTIEIDEVTRRLTYRAWTIAGEVADTFVIEKPLPDPRRALAKQPRDADVQQVAGTNDPPSPR